MNYFKIGAFSLAVCMLAACEKKDKNENDGNINAETTELTAQEQKVKLEGVATQFIQTFNSEDQKRAVELADELAYKYEDYSWDEVEEYGEDNYVVFRSMARSAKQIAHGGAPQLVQPDIYGFPEINATFEANDYTRSWEYKGSSDGGVVLRCRSIAGSTVEAKVVGEGVAIEYSREYEGTPITIKLPSKMVYTVTENQSEIIRIEMNFDVKRSDHFNYTMTAKVVNISLDAKMNITKNNASASCGAYYGGTELFTASAELPNCILIDIKENPTDDDWEEFGDKYTDLGNGVEYGQVIRKVNLLKQIQIESVCDMNTLYRAIEKVENKYNNNGYQQHWWEEYYYQKEYNNEIVDVYNKYQSSKIYYSSDVEQAILKYETTWENERYYDYNTGQYVDVTLYDYEPVIYFPKDGTSYAFEDYFTRGAFSNVINLAENLINSYIKIAKYNDIEPVDFD